LIAASFLKLFKMFI